MKMKPALKEHIREYINPFPNRYTRGMFEIRVLPHEDLDYEGTLKFWRMFKKFPNDFAAAAVGNKPRQQPPPRRRTQRHRRGGEHPLCTLCYFWN